MHLDADKKNLFTVKQYSEQLGASPGIILSMIREAGIDSYRDSSDRLVYDADEIHLAFVEYEKKVRLKNIEYDLELMRRLTPELNRNISEIIKKEFFLAIAIKDDKEAKLSELIGNVRQLLGELGVTASFLTKLTSQVNLAAVTGLTSTLPASLGVAQAGAANHIHEPERRLQDMVGEFDLILGDLDKEKKKSTTKKAPQIGSISSDELMTSPQMACMLKSKVSYDSRKKDVIFSHIDFLEGIIELSSSELLAMTSEEKNIVDEILATFEEDVADAPRFSGFLSSLSTIKEWCLLKADRVPPIVLFLTLNKIAPGTVTAGNFLYMTELDEYYD